MTTSGDLIEEARTRLLSGQEERANRLDGAITSGQLALVYKYDPGQQLPGSIVSVDLEEVRIWEQSGVSASVVERGVNGSTPAAHSDLAMVRIAPKFSPFRILRTFNEELGALSSPANGLYQMKQVELTWSPSAAGYDLAGVTTIDDIYEVEAKVSSAATKDWRTVEGWRLVRGANLTDFPSGFGLSFPAGGGGVAGLPVRVWYRAPFTLLSTTDIAYDVAQTGLPATAVDLLPLGAMLRLVPPRDIKRGFTEGQGDTRRAQEVPVNASTQSVSGLSKFRDRRVGEEAATLRRRYPMRTRRTA